MDNSSETQIQEFILLGFSCSTHTKIALFLFILSAYIINLAANSLFIAVTLGDSRLHSPMYFFLCNLSFLDICYSSVSVPTILEGFLVQKIIIRYAPCISQMYIGLSLGQTECFLLAVMAWDRYVAICNPLNYQQLVTSLVCKRLAIITWSSGFIFSLTSVLGLPVVHFCGHNIVDHIVCEVDALSRLTCRENSLAGIESLLMSLLTLVAPVSFILFTYWRIISTILRIPTAESRRRTFATCGSHLMVVVLFYGTALVIYARPKSYASSEKNKYLALFYGVVVPAINPLIYTLRNKEVKAAVEKVCIGPIAGSRSRA